MLEGMRQVALADVVVELPRVNPLVVLREKESPFRTLEFPVGYPEGVAISYAWKRIGTPRPLTHELLTTVMEQFSVSLEVVEITGLEGDTYLAELVLVSAAERRIVQARPSDALALALRQRVPVPIMVHDSLLKS